MSKTTSVFINGFPHDFMFWLIISNTMNFVTTINIETVSNPFLPYTYLFSSVIIKS